MDSLKINEAAPRGWDSDANGKRWEEYDTIVCPNGHVIDMQKLLDEQDRAKSMLRQLMPAIGGLLGQLRFIYTFRVKTQATDGFNVFVNPQFTDNMDLTGKAFVMAHELMHCLLNHMRRLRGRDMNRANIAGDYEVNCTLCEIPAKGHTRALFTPDVVHKLRGYYDAKYINKSFETIYDMISADKSSKMSNDDQSSDAAQNQNQAANSQENPNQKQQDNKDAAQKKQEDQQKKKEQQAKSAAYQAGVKAAAEALRKLKK